LRYLAIDFGLRRTGLAVCDREERVTSPLCVLEGREGLCRRIRELAGQERIDAIVVGLPLNMDGSEGNQARQTRQFVEALKKQVELPIHFQDERLSSFSAQEKLGALDWTYKKKKRYLDAVAAAEILETFLENKSSD